MADDEDDFFGYSSPIAIGASMRETEESMTVHDELCKEVDQVVYEEGPSRRRKRRNYDVDLDDLDEDIEILSSTMKQTKKKKQKSDDDQIVLSDEEDDDDDDSLSPSTISYDYPSDSNTIKLLQAAEFASYNLKNSAPVLPVTPNTSANTSVIDTSLVCSPEHKLTLRVRCKGILHKVTIDESDQLSCLISQLADTLNKSPDQILLQYKSNDIDTTLSPKELKLSSVDILDAFVLDKSAPTTNQKDPKSKDSSFKIKIQSSQKTFMTYSVDKDKPLEPILCKFAADLGYARKDLSFWFDGEKIHKNQSPEDLDMENNDVIDANIIKKKK